MQVPLTEMEVFQGVGSAEVLAAVKEMVKKDRVSYSVIQYITAVYFFMLAMTQRVWLLFSKQLLY